MAITFSCPRSSTILSIWGENMHLGASPRALRIVELLGQEKDICFQSSIYYAKWTKFENLLQNWQTLAANSYLFALPIPQTEFSGNSNMVQNPGY